MTPTNRGTIAATEIWVLISAWCSLSGWALSAAGHLDRAGYAASFFLGAILLFFWIRHRRAGTGNGAIVRRGGKYRRRFRRALPFIFLLTAALAFVGGVLYVPNNYDALTYRFPRILHWLAGGRWYWIDAPENRMNYSGTGFEWLMAPLFVFTGSDRLFFLPNILSQLLLPGLVFSCFTSLGISRWVAWQWMWLIPSGYCFALQAGSIGNDTFAAVYLLAAIVFARRAARFRSVENLWLAALAAALMTGAKASNLPLLLPCVIAAWPALPLLKHKMPGTAVVIFAAGFASFLPMAALNLEYSGDWTGSPRNTGRMKLERPVYGIAGNAIMIVVDNIQPSICPVASQFNKVVARVAGTPAWRRIVQNYPRFGAGWAEFASEEYSGVGLGLSFLFFASACFAILNLKRGADRAWPRLGAATVGGCYAALLCYMAKIGSEAAPRLVAAYYPLLFAAPLLHPSAAVLARRRWWRIAALLASLGALPAVILTPSRPLWPAATVLSALDGRHPGNRVIERAAAGYSVHANRADDLAPLKKYLPDGTEVVGFIGSDDPQISLWRPFGSRRVEDISTSGQFESGRPGTRIYIASATGLQSIFGETGEEFSRLHNARILHQEKLLTKVGRGAEDWFVFQLDAE